jgi:hypothetical protein
MPVQQDAIQQQGISAGNKKITTLPMPHLHQRYYPGLECSEKIKKRHLVCDHASLSGVDTKQDYELLQVQQLQYQGVLLPLDFYALLTNFRNYIYFLRSIWLLTLVPSLSITEIVKNTA